MAKKDSALDDVIFIQGLSPYGHEWQFKGKTLVLPQLKAFQGKNILFANKEEYEFLQKDAVFNDLIVKKQARILDKVPTSYYTSAEQLAKANAKAQDAKQEAENLKRELEVMKAKLEEKDRQLADVGGAR